MTCLWLYNMVRIAFVQNSRALTIHSFVENSLILQNFHLFFYFATFFGTCGCGSPRILIFVKMCTLTYYTFVHAIVWVMLTQLTTAAYSFIKAWNNLHCTQDVLQHSVLLSVLEIFLLSLKYYILLEDGAATFI